MNKGHRSLCMAPNDQTDPIWCMSWMVWSGSAVSSSMDVTICMLHMDVFSLLFLFCCGEMVTRNWWARMEAAQRSGQNTARPSADVCVLPVSTRGQSFGASSGLASSWHVGTLISNNFVWRFWRQNFCTGSRSLIQTADGGGSTQGRTPSSRTCRVRPSVLAGLDEVP